MKKLLPIIALVLMTLAVNAQSGTKISFSATDLQGNAVTDALFADNKLTMVNIWGTFCPPCIREMPGLAALHEANKAKDVAVVGIVIDVADRTGAVLPRAKADADAIVATTGAQYTHIVPSKAMMSGMLRGVQAVPATIFVDSNGKQVGEMYLGARSQQDWQKVIDELLKKQR